MKLTDLRPCDSCGGPLLGKETSICPPLTAHMFHVIRCTRAMLNPQATREVMGLTQFFGGSAVGLAEVFAPNPDAVTVIGDKEPALTTELFLCEKCAYSGKTNLPGLIERRNEAKAESENDDE